MAEKMTAARLRKELAAYDEKALKDLICKLYSNCKDAKKMLTVEFGDGDTDRELYEECREGIRKTFHPGHELYKLPLAKAKKYISEYNKLGKSPGMLIDLRMYYLECCAVYSDWENDSLYNSISSTFEAIVKELDKLHDIEMYRRYYPRLKKVLDVHLRGCGYGLDVCAADILSRMDYAPDEEKCK